MKKHFMLFPILLLLMGIQTRATSQNLIPEVQTSKYFDISKPLTEMSPLDNTIVKEWKKGIVKNRFRYKKNGTPDTKIIMPEIQEFQGYIKTKAPTVNIEGCNNSDNSSGVAPPDTQGDVGPNHYVQMVNNVTEIFDKNGNTVWGPQNSSTFWSGFIGSWTGTNDGDPIVLYDEQADRWLISQFAVNTGDGTQWELIAVSTSPDPTGSYYRYAFEFTDMPDYPKLGIWLDGYYLSANRFTTSSGSFNGVYACALDRESMISGDPTAQMIKFDLSSSSDPYSMLPSDCDGEFPTAGTPNYFCYDTDDDTYWSVDRVKVWAFTANWTTPANSTFTEISSLTPASFNSSFSADAAIDQPSTTQDLHTLSDRMMFRAQYRKFSGYESILLSRTVNLGSDHAGIRWYELRKTTGNWSIYQQGTYAPDADSRWMSSMAMNGNGDIALGYSVSGASTYPSIRYTGRRDGDALGVMTISEESIFTGIASQSGVNRWGDYSMMSVDPSDDNSFWYTQEYSNGGWNWRTRIAKFNFPDTNEPANFIATTISSSEINLTWNLNSNNDNVLVAWSSDGNFGIPVDGTTYSSGQTIPGGGIVLQYNTNTSYDHIGLNSSTTYYYKAWSYDGSAYTNGVTASSTTFCGITNTYPWVEDFEGTFLPDCWNKYTPGSANDISQSNTQNHTSGGSYSARFSSYSSSTDYNQYLFTPQIHVPLSGQLSFWHRKYNTSAELLQYGISTTTNPNDYTWTTVTLSNTAWQQTTVDLSSYAGQDVYIGFHYYGNYLYYVYIDDVQVTGTALPIASVFASPGCLTGSISVNSDQSGTQTFYLRDNAGSAIDDWTGSATSHEFTGLSDGTYRGQVEKDGNLSVLSNPVVLTNITQANDIGEIMGETFPCEGDIETYSVEYYTGYTYFWAFPGGWDVPQENNNEITVTVGPGGMISVFASNECSQSTDQVWLGVTSGTIPEAPSAVYAGDTEICPGDNTVLTYSGGSGDTFKWYTTSCGGTSVGSGNNLTVYPTQTTTYYGRWENNCGNSTCLSVTVAVGTETAITAQPDDIYANQGDNVSFTVVADGSNLSYQWRFNSSNISGAENEIYEINNVQVSDAGNYDVVVTGDCGEETSDVSVLTVNSSIEELLKYGIQIFPNPSNGILNINFMNSKKNVLCKISDITGKNVYQEILHEKYNLLKLNPLKKGIYFVKLYFDNKVFVSKIVIE